MTLSLQWGWSSVLPLRVWLPVSIAESRVLQHENAIYLLRGPTYVAIGRALQPFPRSKRSRHVSTHSAFQLGLSTLEGRIRLERRRGAPASEGHHLPSSLHPLTSLLTSLPWRTFTVSQLLPLGIWLLRRLRPPRRTLACSRPTIVGDSCDYGVPQFQHKRRSSNP